MATGTVTKNIIVLKSNNISVAVASGGKGTQTFTMQGSAPSGYTLVARQFVRTDDGGYGVIVTCNLGVGRYIVYESTGSAPTLQGYVLETYVK